MIPRPPRPWGQTFVALSPTFTSITVMALALLMLPGHVIAYIVVASLACVGNAALVIASHPIMRDGAP